MLTFTSVQTRDAQKGLRMVQPHSETCLLVGVNTEAVTAVNARPLTQHDYREERRREIELLAPSAP